MVIARKLLGGLIAVAALGTSLAVAPANGKPVKHWPLDEKLLPQSWTRPAGWHVAKSVKHPSADGDFTGDGHATRAVLMTNGSTMEVVVFVDFRKRPGWTPANLRVFIPYTNPVRKEISYHDGISASPPGDYPLPDHFSSECNVTRFMHCRKSSAPTYQPPTDIFAIRDSLASWLFGWNGHDIDVFAIGI